MDNKEEDLVGFKQNIEEKEVLNAENYSCFKKYKIFIVIFISILIFVASIIILYFFYFKKDKDYEDKDYEDEIEDSSLQNYTFKAVYYTEKNRTKSGFLVEYSKVLEMKVDGIIYYNNNLYTFNNSGYRTIYVLLDIENLNSLEHLFIEDKCLKSVHFAKNLNTSHIIKMNRMFLNCLSLTSVDFSNFNTENVRDMSYMFSNCSSLTSIDLSFSNTKNVYSMNNMFENCESLLSLDL